MRVRVTLSTLAALGLLTGCMAVGFFIPGGSQPTFTEPPVSALATPVPVATSSPTPVPRTTSSATPVPIATSSPTPVPAILAEKIANGLGMEFRRIPAGTFMMGSPSNEEDRRSDEDQYQVILTNDFYMQTTEVTQPQWQAVMGNNPSPVQGDSLPVEAVSWDNAQIFISKLNARGEGTYRLPTEAEWEYAARAGTTTRYACGNDVRCVDQMGWTDRNSEGKTHPVAQKQPNAWGLYDMHGIISEWVQDWYGSYPSGSSTNPTGPSKGSYRVHRGGILLNLFGYDFRSAARGLYEPTGRFGAGSRLVREP